MRLCLGRHGSLALLQHSGPRLHPGLQQLLLQWLYLSMHHALISTGVWSASQAVTHVRYRQHPVATCSGGEGPTAANPGSPSGRQLAQGLCYTARVPVHMRCSAVALKLLPHPALQYTARLNADKLKSHIHRLNQGKLGKQFFNMRLCPEDVSDQLSGYEHNAVSPIGIKTPLPVIMSHQIAKLQPDFFFLGAGEVDLKVGFSAAEFVEKYKPMVLDCTY